MDSFLFRVKKEQIRMMEKRGYNVEREQGIYNMSLEDFYNIYNKFATDNNFSFRRALLNVYEKGEDRALVSFVDNPAKSKQLGVDPVRAFISLFQQYRCNQGILISQQPLSKEASEELNKTTAKFVQHFLESEVLTVAASIEHFLTPKIEILSETEAMEFLSENKLKPSQLPFIKRSDPVIKYYGVGRGTIIREQATVISGESLVDNYKNYSIVD